MCWRWIPSNCAGSAAIAAPRALVARVRLQLHADAAGRARTRASSISSFASTFAPVCHASGASHVQPISTLRCSGRKRHGSACSRAIDAIRARDRRKRHLERRCAPAQGSPSNAAVEPLARRAASPAATLRSARRRPRHASRPDEAQRAAAARSARPRASSKAQPTRRDDRNAPSRGRRSGGWRRDRSRPELAHGESDPDDRTRPQPRQGARAGCRELSARPQSPRQPAPARPRARCPGDAACSAMNCPSPAAPRRPDAACAATS